MDQRPECGGVFKYIDHGHALRVRFCKMLNLEKAAFWLISTLAPLASRDACSLRAIMPETRF